MGKGQLVKITNQSGHFRTPKNLLPLLMKALKLPDSVEIQEFDDAHQGINNLLDEDDFYIGAARQNNDGMMLLDGFYGQSYKTANYHPSVVGYTGNALPMINNGGNH